MCFDRDALPAVPPIAGAAIDTEDLVLEAEDGNSLAAFVARAENSRGPAVLVLPDVRGLYPFYEELACRFAEVGYDSVTIDYFGRSAGAGKRDDEFPFMDHVQQSTFDGIKADSAAAVAYLRKDDADRAVFTIGFCFGGSNSWHQAANGLGLTGAIGFYGHPNREFPQGATPMVQRVGEIECPILGLMGGADPGIPQEEIDGYDTALTGAGVTHELHAYPGAPHSFFDRAYEEFANESADAWQRVLAFIEANS
jgi:carboxymethylenebutenolidase